MGQDKILKILEKSLRPLCVREIRPKHKEGVIYNCLNKMLKHNEIKFILIPIKLPGVNGYQQQWVKHYYVTLK